jgi:uncharacterized YigZ family protein
VIEEYQTLAAELEHEIDKVKGSRFRATVAPVASAEEALALVERVRKTHHDARHHGFAWRLGHSGAELRYSDDGEPSGSTGKPIFQELEGRALTDSVVVVTRWFGGTKLGVGGLVRAYGGAAAAALDLAEKRTVVLTERIVLGYAYNCAGPIEGLLADLDLRPANSEYAEDVTLTLDVPLARIERLLEEFRDRTAGRGSVERAG